MTADREYFFIVNNKGYSGKDSPCCFFRCKNNRMPFAAVL